MPTPRPINNTTRSSLPQLLFYCQHSLGMGHLMRSLALVEGLSQCFDVTFLCGGELPNEVKLPAGIRLELLPTLTMDVNGLLESDDPNNLDTTRRRRTQQIMDAYERTRPACVLIELFPFGRKKFAFELLPLLERAQGETKKPLVVCSVRDLLVTDRHDQQRHDQKAAACLNQFFDLVLVHADARFARLEASFSAAGVLRVPVAHTGFVCRFKQAAPTQVASRLLVSVGGGKVGHTLCRLAAIAAPHLKESFGLTTEIITGPFAPEDLVTWLHTQADAHPALKVQRFVDDLAFEMSRSRLSLSQCGYNTAMDILNAGVPAIVMPYSEGRENEQSERARRLHSLDLVQVISDQATIADLLHSVGIALQSKPSGAGFDLNGVGRSCSLIQAATRQAPQFQPSLRKAPS